MQFRIIFSLVALVLLGGCSSSYQEELYTQKPAHYSYIVGNIDSDAIDVESYADVYATPASCQKIITALLSFKALGPHYRYKTKLHVTKKHGKLHDVVLTFSGDPTLTSEDMIKLFAPLKGRAVNGTIFLDASLFQTPPHSPNLMQNDVGTGYGQPVSTINLDKNVITVSITPTTLSKRAHVTNDAGYPVETTVVTTAEPSSVSLHEEGGRIQAKGHINVKDAPLTIKRSPHDLDTYVLRKMELILKDVKITAPLSIIHDPIKLPARLIFLRGTGSKPLRTLIPPALKISENLTFDSLFLTLLHSQRAKEVTSWDQGDAVIKSLMKRYFEMDLAQARFVDGSGISRYNRIQPRQLFQILRYGYQVPEFVKALPYPREKKSSLAMRPLLPSTIRGKTGTMSGIACLCGYNLTSPTPKAFVIMTNNFSPPMTEMTLVIDHFIAEVLAD